MRLGVACEGHVSECYVLIKQEKCAWTLLDKSAGPEVTPKVIYKLNVDIIWVETSLVNDVNIELTKLINQIQWKLLS